MRKKGIVREATEQYGVAVVAKAARVSKAEVDRWLTGDAEPSREAAKAARQLLLSEPGSLYGGFTFIDLFAGIGGFRIAFESAGGTCQFSSEYDRYSQDTYEACFGERPDFSSIGKEELNGDITQLQPLDVPDHEILLGGFPCQPFSLAGVSKKESMGRPHGFADPTQGTLFFNIKEILMVKKPKAFLLENVKNLVSHVSKSDGGTVKTFDVISEALYDIGYEIFPRVIDAVGWAPQHRERIYIVGFRRPDKFPGQRWGIAKFDELYQLKPPSRKRSLAAILEKRVPEKYTLGPGTWDTLKRHKANHQAKGQGFGYGLISPPFKDKTTRTISARYHKDGAEILIDQGRGKRPRRLTPLECCRLMGFPKKFEKLYARNGVAEQPVSDTQAYRQFGNAVVVPVVEAIAHLMVDKLRSVGAFDRSEDDAVDVTRKRLRSSSSA